MRIPVVMREARACTACAGSLPLGPNPLIQGSSASRILIIGQAPGRVAHESGVPWNDRSGDRLREWMGLGREEFYNERLVALMPMGFCFPGTSARGDMPPRPECAPMWHDRMIRALPSVELTVIVGRYAFERYLSEHYATITEAVAAYRVLLPTRVALPHPSGRNGAWVARHPWFERSALPAIRRRVREAAG